MKKIIYVGTLEDIANMMEQSMEENNPYGLAVRKCCASCSFKELKPTDDVRFCHLYDETVTNCSICDHWVMSDNMQSAQRTQGRVKRRAYQLYVMDIRANEDAARRERRKSPRMTLDQIRAAFEEKYGSIYEEI